MPFEQVGRFRVDRNKRLGRDKGSYGTVFLANDDRGRTVAAKEIYVGDDDPDYQKKVQAEVDYHKEIPPHENLIGFIDSINKESYVWIFTDHCESGDVDDFCQTNSMSDEEKVDIMIQVARGIHHLHTQNPPIVHRDIKPGNILLTVEDGRLCAKICDLGVAKFVEKFGGATKAFSTYCGTQGYMAPELFQYDKTGKVLYGIKVDIFSAGLFFHALWEAKDKTELQPIESK